MIDLIDFSQTYTQAKTHRQGNDKIKRSDG